MKIDGVTRLSSLTLKYSSSGDSSMMDSPTPICKIQLFLNVVEEFNPPPLLPSRLFLETNPKKVGLF